MNRSPNETAGFGRARRATMRLGLVGILLTGLSGCAATPAVSEAPVIDRSEAPSRPLGTSRHALVLAKRFLATTHPMIDIWRQHIFGRLLRDPQAWERARDRMGLARVPVLTYPESISVIDAVHWKVPVPDLQAMLQPRDEQVLDSDLLVGWRLIMAPYEFDDLTAGRSNAGSLDERSAEVSGAGMNGTDGAHSPAAVRVDGDRIDRIMQISALAFLALVFLIPVLCSMYAARMTPPIRGSPAAQPAPGVRRRRSSWTGVKPVRAWSLRLLDVPGQPSGGTGDEWIRREIAGHWLLPADPE